MDGFLLPASAQGEAQQECVGSAGIGAAEVTPREPVLMFLNSSLTSVDDSIYLI